ncbi:hypothetical protein FISHEDRAFT_65500 [Fistulina hepatica ATCC 64428]|nr:hypothetical protein FISHEDRAFT_65500 [Fistulina hepatica ATCC 64428]
MSTASSNSRASLLSGLRTGGVRSASSNVAQSAAQVSGYVPRQVPQVQPHYDGDVNGLADMAAQSLYISGNQRPFSPAFDGGFSRQQPQTRGLNPHSAAFTPSFAAGASVQQQPAQADMLQLQMMQLELLKMQALQQQQYQQELILMQAQLEQQKILQSRRPSLPALDSHIGYDLRSATLSAQMRRTNQAEQLRSQLGLDHAKQSGLSDEPMTAAIDGRFGSRPSSMAHPVRIINPLIEGVPYIPKTSVISGGTSLGNPSSNNGTSPIGPSKSDTATTWRRGGNSSATRSATSPSVRVTPPRVAEEPAVLTGTLPSPAKSDATMNTVHTIKTRPKPLSFSDFAKRPIPTVSIVAVNDGTADGNDDDASSTGSSKLNTPTTPSSSELPPMPLSPREEATRKLYEGLGIGRPNSGQPAPQRPPSAVHQKLVAQTAPMRQPRGPPSGADELGPKNFATRIRRQAIGGLGVLMGARERRELVEAF